MTSSDFRYCSGETIQVFEASGVSSLDALNNLVQGLESVSGIISSINVSLSEGEYYATAYVVV